MIMWLVREKSSGKVFYQGQWTEAPNMVVLDIQDMDDTHDMVKAEPAKKKDFTIPTGNHPQTNEAIVRGSISWQADTVTGEFFTQAGAFVKTELNPDGKWKVLEVGGVQK